VQSELKKKVIVITGASSGIGLSCADIFAKAGFSLVLGARRLDRLKEAKAQFLQGKSQEPSPQGKGQEILCESLDVTSESSVQEFAAKITEKFADFSVILINNAGLALGRDPLVSSQREHWTQMVETNFLGLLRVTQALLPWILKSTASHIVNIGSIASFQSYAGGAVYAGTKHGVRAISAALREELMGTGVRVTEIDPGMVETEFSLVRLGDGIKAKDVYKGMQPLTPLDIAETIYFVTSRPSHVNIDQIVILPTDQVSVGKVHRNL
jgi:NADP-dependent 3-hydroxy acid dehydrogenase YdfG